MSPCPGPNPCPAAGDRQGWLSCHGGVGSVYIQRYYPCGLLDSCGGSRGWSGCPRAGKQLSFVAHCGMVALSPHRDALASSSLAGQ